MTDLVAELRKRAKDAEEVANRTDEPANKSFWNGERSAFQNAADLVAADPLYKAARDLPAKVDALMAALDARLLERSHVKDEAQSRFLLTAGDPAVDRGPGAGGPSYIWGLAWREAKLEAGGTWAKLRELLATLPAPPSPPLKEDRES